MSIDTYMFGFHPHHHEIDSFSTQDNWRFYLCTCLLTLGYIHKRRFLDCTRIDGVLVCIAGDPKITPQLLDLTPTAADVVLFS